MKFSFPFAFGNSTRHEKAVRVFEPVVAAANAFEEEFKKLSDEDLKAKVLAHTGKDVAQLKDDIPMLFAAIREASRRTINMRHFDVQLLGGMALLSGYISEMKTGEGKTLVATLPLIVHALAGKGAHLITVNDYLARRDADWMRPVYEFFGLSVGTIVPGQTPDEKRAAYAADITYGTNNEFGFDYLRDNMAGKQEQITQRALYYGLVDEVDSILIDEARTPLIISAPDTESTELYRQFARLVPTLQENTHYNIDEKRRSATLTDEGISFVEKELNIDNMYAEKGIRFVHHLEQALRARTLYHRDKDYVVQNGQVIIVDEFTGRLMEGRRYSEGLHQALEAKEAVQVQQESRTLATITFQNFFRLYKTLAGMTGTAVTSAEEFEKVYNLEVAVIPTNKPVNRSDKTDRIYINEKAKFDAVVQELKRRHEKGQPVLVGTIAIEKSEYLSVLLKKEGVPHEVLNAKHHAREAEIIARAGQRGAVTISTNMAGRGTDIKLGESVTDLGGLFVLGTERHEARRIDNQLRGRSGRQGDPGETQFFVSLEDDVMRVFGGSKIQSLMKRLSVPEDEAIENRLVTKAIEGAQERVEGYYFDMRKQVLSYDDVMNRQRNAIYTLRRSILLSGTWKEFQAEPVALHDQITTIVSEYAQNLVAIHDEKEIIESVFALSGEKLEQGQANTEAVEKLLLDHLEKKRQTIGTETFSQLERAVALRAIDMLWMDHLDTMDYLRAGIGLRGYGQRDPLVEYQKEGHRLFQDLLVAIKNQIIEVVFKAEAVRQESYEGKAQHESITTPHRITPKGQLQNPNKNVGRNDPCPCGAINPATKQPYKYKKCGLINAPYHIAT